MLGYNDETNLKVQKNERTFPEQDSGKLKSTFS